MTCNLSRRQFTTGAAATSAALALPVRAFAAGSNFKIGVISDEISGDFDHACYVIAKEFGLQFVELRELWGKNLQAISDTEIADAQKIIAKYGLQVTDISSPLFKVSWPGAPPTKYGSADDRHGAADATLAKQDDVMDRSISLAKQFKTNKVRCFDFWRLDDVAPYRADINATLQKAAEKCAKQQIQLVLRQVRRRNARAAQRAEAGVDAIDGARLAGDFFHQRPAGAHAGDEVRAVAR